MNTINYPENYTIRGFIYENIPYPKRKTAVKSSTPAYTRWRASLCLDGKKIAQITASHPGPINLLFITEEHEQEFSQVVRYMKLQTRDFTQEKDFIEAWILYLAEQAYHARRLELKSKHNTIFKLEGDAVDDYQMLPQQPYTPEIEGKLRLMYGKRLVFIVRSPPTRNALPNMSATKCHS